MKITMRDRDPETFAIGELPIGEIIHYDYALHLLVGNAERLWNEPEPRGDYRLAVHLPSMQLRAVPRKERASIVKAELIVE